MEQKDDNLDDSSSDSGSKGSKTKSSSGQSKSLATSPTTTPTTSTTTTSSSEKQKSKIISSISSVHSKSLDDVKSVDLMDFTIEQQQPPLGKVVHSHNIPSGWLCNYDPSSDQYSFEFQGEEVVVQEASTSKITAEQRLKVSTKDEEVTAITPTIDSVAQTSRRPTLNAFECRYGYHFPTSPTSSMISDLAKEVQKQTGPGGAQKPKTRPVGFGKAKLTVFTEEEEQAKRLDEMFPTATRPIIDQMIRIYHGREGLIKAALISLGYRRATEYGVQKQTAQSPIMLMMSKPASKKLFDKLVSYFPDKDESLIKELMYRHKEVEHEIISALVEAKGDQTTTSSIQEATAAESRRAVKLDKNGAIMKLRYLKVLFPTCQEIELYHLLHCNDLNTQKVIEEVEKKGHKRANIDEVMQNRKSQSQQMRAQQAAMAAAKDKDKAPTADPMERHKNRTKPMVSQARANNLKDNLKKSFETVDDALLLLALDAADYSESMAKKFLDEMEPIDEALYKQHYVIQRDQEPAVVLYPCKGTQKSEEKAGFVTSFTTHESISIPKSVVECENALALLKVDACTYTQEDFEAPKFTHAKGKKSELARGPTLKSSGVRESLRKGPSEGLAKGSKYEQIQMLKTKSTNNARRARGHNPSLFKGPNSHLIGGHNPDLLKRIHPFFQKQDERYFRNTGNLQTYIWKTMNEHEELCRVKLS